MPTQKQLDAFKSVEWAAQYMTSPDWDVRERSRGSVTGDIFNRETIRANDGVEHWLELFPKPVSPGALIERTISLVKFGTGLTGFDGICHGGAILTLLDEGLAYVMVANEIGGREVHFADLKVNKWQETQEPGRSVSEMLEGFYATAHLDIKFLKPVLCPGVIGIDAQLVEKTHNKYRVRAIIKDEKGRSLMRADGVWVKIGSRGAKL